MLTKRQLLGSAALVVLTAAAPRLGAQEAQPDPGRPNTGAVRDLAEAGFIYGLPIVMNYAVMYEYAVDRDLGQFKAPFNQIKNEPNVFTYKDTAIPTPNSDTPYSFVWMDLRAEPIVLSVPAVDPKRYYSVMLCDGNTYNYGYIGTRATGSEAGDYMVVGPEWQGPTPPGIKKVFRSSTQFSVAGYRTQLFNAGDIGNVKQVQAGYKVSTLSSLHEAAATAGSVGRRLSQDRQGACADQLFRIPDFALQFAPAEANETDIRAQLARIGIGAGKTFDLEELPPEEKLAVAEGMKEGERKVDEAIANAGKAINGWRVSSLPGDSAHYNGDWLKRAAAAKAGIYGNDAAEATYPITRIDSDGQTLDGSRHDYTLTFPPGQQPPVNAFWSVTMYDGKTQLLIENPINRYLINSPMLPEMKTSVDGSLTIYIQHQSPGPDKEPNWLPAPNGPIYLVMRLYWPKTTPPSILPVGEGTWQPPGVRQV